MFWRKKSIPCEGMVLFRGTIPPRAEDFASLKEQGIDIAPLDATADEHWRLKLTHRSFGSIQMFSPRDFTPPAPMAIRFAPELVPHERELAALGRSGVVLRMDTVAGDDHPAQHHVGAPHPREPG